MPKRTKNTAKSVITLASRLRGVEDCHQEGQQRQSRQHHGVVEQAEPPVAAPQPPDLRSEKTKSSMPTKFQVVETWVDSTAASRYGRWPKRMNIQKAMVLTTRPVEPTAANPTARCWRGVSSVSHAGG